MPQTYETVGYKGTGFNAVNIPDSPALLETCEKVHFKSVFKRQGSGLTQVKVDASWGEVKDIDYLSVGSDYYAVTGVEMASDRTAVLTLEQDYVTTLGGPSALAVIDGWVSRSHAKEDELFGNILPEGFTPTRDLVMDPPEYFTPEAPGESLTVVGATIDLNAVKRVADKYVSEDADPLSVAVPRVPPIKEGTTIQVQMPPTFETTDVRHNTLPNLSLFNFRTAKVQEAMAVVRSLGLETAITACYVIPGGYHGTPEYFEAGDPTIVLMPGGHATHQTATLPYKFQLKDGYQPKNNKVYALANTYCLRSLCSGEGMDFEAYNITGASGEAAPTFIMYSDPSPEGCPFYAPKNFHGRPVSKFEQVIKGETWQNTPIAFSAASGYGTEGVEAMRAFRKANPLADLTPTRDTVVNGAGGNDSVLGSVAGALYSAAAMAVGFAGGAAENIIPGVSKVATTAYDKADIQYNREKAMNLQAPELVFPRSHSVQNFVGNGAAIFRTRMDDEDIKRFDRYLTMFGYAQDKPLEPEDFTSRQYFNFVQLQNVSIKSTAGMRLRMGCEKQLLGGVRVWHVLPDASYYANNPLKEGK